MRLHIDLIPFIIKVTLSSEEKKDFQNAAHMYETVLKFTPNHANTLYNYAVLLDTHLKRKDEAEDFYRKTLDIEPKHAYALYNLAVLLEENTFGTIFCNQGNYLSLSTSVNDGTMS